MKKYVLIFFIMALLSCGVIFCSGKFAEQQIGKVTLMEETLSGTREVAAGLTAGFRMDSGSELHWMAAYDYSSGMTESVFKRGEMSRSEEVPLYDEIRFNGWSEVPYATFLEYDRLEGLQTGEIQSFYDELEARVLQSGQAEEGRIRLKDYIDYYPVSFRFQLGGKIYSSDDALRGLKLYDKLNMLSEEKDGAYEDIVDLYVAFNRAFRIPVLETEYHDYKVTGEEDYDYRTSLGYNISIGKDSGSDADFYEFDPIIAIQEENIIDGKKWIHPDLSGGLDYEVGGELDGSHIGKIASDYNLKNRLLFIVNNRTAKGSKVDVSQIEGGYGIYELPVETVPTATVRFGRRSGSVQSPVPLPDQLSMVYPLDEEAEYAEVSLSEDHRYLAVFSVKDGWYCVEFIDADLWTSPGPVRMFPAGEKLAYAWGEDGSLAATNHEDYIAIFARTGSEDTPYQAVYCGEAEEGLDKAFFDTEIDYKEKSLAAYECGRDRGLQVAAADGKVALVQNLLAGNGEEGIRNAGLECAVFDRTGMLYRGILKSNITDMPSGMSGEEITVMKESLTEKTAAQIIEPVRNENLVYW